MLGLRPDIDQHLVGLGISKKPTSTKFTSQLKDRFHTSGISGSMEKHKLVLQKAKEIKADDSSPPPIKISEIRRKEIQDDTEKLQSLEAKLAEVP